MTRIRKYPPEVRERAVRLVLEHEEEYSSQRATISSVAEQIGCTAETLRSWVRQVERDEGRRPGLRTDERERLRDLERENREPRRLNEIFVRRRPISHRRSSTADLADGGVRRRPQVRVRSRAAL